MGKWIPTVLLGGRHFEGVWHSAVRAFGKEYWFGGMIFESDPNAVPFGKPARVLQLGFTWLSREDLQDFTDGLSDQYNPKSYDVLRRNCNHFSNEVLRFLLRGAQLTNDVIMQPQWAQSTLLVTTLRPALNNWLGGFGEDVGSSTGDCGGGTPRTSCAKPRVDDLTDGWRKRLQPGDVVMRRVHFADRPQVCRVLAIAGGHVDLVEAVPSWTQAGTRSCMRPNLRHASLEELLAWTFVKCRGVSVRELYPPSRDGEMGPSLLRVGVLTDEPINGNALQERHQRQQQQQVTWQPLCTRGHLLHKAPRSSWFAKVPPCRICGDVDQLVARRSCDRCAFDVCSNCLKAGSELCSGGGVFADVLTLELAQSLLAPDNQGWLKYKSHWYFNRADHNSCGTLDWSAIRLALDQLSVGLGVARLGDAELADIIIKSVEQVPRDRIQVDQDGFAKVFVRTLERALWCGRLTASFQAPADYTAGL